MEMQGPVWHRWTNHLLPGTPFSASHLGNDLASTDMVKCWENLHQKRWWNPVFFRRFSHDPIVLVDTLNRPWAATLNRIVHPHPQRSQRTPGSGTLRQGHGTHRSCMMIYVVSIQIYSNIVRTGDLFHGGLMDSIGLNFLPYSIFGWMNPDKSQLFGSDSRDSSWRTWNWWSDSRIQRPRRFPRRSDSKRHSPRPGFGKRLRQSLSQNSTLKCLMSFASKKNKTCPKSQFRPLWFLYVPLLFSPWNQRKTGHPVPSFRGPANLIQPVAGNGRTHVVRRRPPHAEESRLKHEQNICYL